MAVLSFTARDFRSRQAHLFDLADRGECVVIRRGKKQAYTLVPVSDSDITITPELQAKIDLARQEVRDGHCVAFKSHEEMDNFFDNL